MIFRNEFYFLSNMYPCHIRINGLHFKSAEAAFQSFKMKDRTARNIFEEIDGFEAKKLGKKVFLRDDWNDIKVDVMKAVVKAKFHQNPELMEKLKEVKGIIQEDNTWHDTFWGVCNGRGENHLGKILMSIRDEEV